MGMVVIIKHKKRKKMLQTKGDCMDKNVKIMKKDNNFFVFI